MKSLRFVIGIVIALQCGSCAAQHSYQDSVQRFINNYINKHEVVTGTDREYLHFYPINKDYRIVASFERVKDGKWFSMETSGQLKQIFRIYGVIRFNMHDTAVQLNVYQSQSLMPTTEYKDYLFLPFTDITSGNDTYGAGRYIDLRFDDIAGNKVTIDFNKAYNPYCAYVSGKYNCPIPPRENSLKVAILAGEKTYGKH